MPIISDRSQIANLKETQKECYICDKTAGLTERSSIVTCDICSNWICKECSSIESKLYEFLIKNKTDFNFICLKYRGQLPKIKDLVKISQRQEEIDSTISLMSEKIESNRTSITNLENLNIADRLSKVEQVIMSNKLDDEEYPPLVAINAATKKLQEEIYSQQETTEKISTDLEEEKRKEAKKSNLIIYGIPESTDNIENQMMKDFTTIQQLYADRVELDKTDITSIIRLGKKKENQIRPIRVTFCEAQKRKEILVNNNGLRLEGENLKQCNCKFNPGKHIHVNVTTDKTQQERDSENKLREEMKARRSRGEDVTIKRGKIVNSNYQGTQARWATISQNV